MPIIKPIQREGIVQFIKYSTVGISNTVVTGIVIYIMQNLLGYSMELSNVVGYIIGLINSFIWNSKWTFSSAVRWRSFAGFVFAFLLCYAIQMGVLQVLKYNTSIDRYVIQLIAMGVYTLSNFGITKYWVFKK